MSLLVEPGEFRDEKGPAMGSRGLVVPRMGHEGRRYKSLSTSERFNGPPNEKGLAIAREAFCLVAALRA
jgi:hypothetical protein